MTEQVQRSVTVLDTAKLVAGAVVLGAGIAAFYLLPDLPIAMEQGLRFAIREGGKTVGAGVVAKILE